MQDGFERIAWAGRTASSSLAAARVQLGMTAQSGEVWLVLGGGGPVGIAWECGLLAGLADGGVELREAFDQVLGTSAGAIVGAHLAAYGSVEELYRSHSNPLPDMGQAPQFSGMVKAWLRSRAHPTLGGRRRSLGASARRAALPGEDGWVRWIGSFLPSTEWPERPFLVTAIDCETGELRTFSRADGVPFATAVAASCSVPSVFPLVHIRGRAYMDGGMGSPTNALLARDARAAVIADPLARLYGWLGPLRREQRTLAASGVRVAALAVSDAVHKLVGFNWMDMSRTGEIARLAREQGRAEAARVLRLLEGAGVSRATADPSLRSG